MRAPTLRSPLSLLVALAASAALLGSCAREPVGGAAHNEVRFAMNSLPPSLGNPFRGNGRPGSLLWSAIFDGLTHFDEAGKLQPALATSWTLQSPTVWRFDLRQGVTFSNGRPFDSSSVVKLFDWLQSPEGRRSLMGGELKGIKAVRAVGPYQVDVETTAPDPLLPKRMSAVMVVEPDEWKKLGADAFAQKPVGTGAFMVQRWDPNRRRLTLVRSPTSWRTTTIDRVVLLELPNGSGRTQALLSGDVDIAVVDIEDTPRLERNGIPVVTSPSGQVKGFTFNVVGGDPKSPVQDVRVRRALNYAIDKEAISASLLGSPPPSGQPASREAFGYDPTIPPYPYDPAKARRLLAEAGYPNGFHLVLNVLKDTAPGDDMISQEVAEYWRQVGVPTTLKVVTFAEHMRNYTMNKWVGDAFSISWNTYQYYDVTRPMEDFSCNRSKPFFCDREITAKLDKAKQIMDDGEREKALQDLGRAYRDAAPSVFILEHRDVIAHSPRLTNFKMRQRVPVYEQMIWRPAAK